MCGRFVQLALQLPDRSPWPEVTDELLAITARYNIAPTARIVIINDEEGSKAARKMRWGLIPPWARDLKGGYSTFNARIETVAEKPAFRSAFKAPRRCLIPMKGYYEWKEEVDGKQPYFIERADGEMLYAAGLWEPRRDFQDDDEDGSCTMIVRDAVGPAGSIHSRMPVFVDPEHGGDWMTAGPDEAMALLLASEPPSLSVQAVSRRVNNARNPGGPDMIEPAND